MSSAETVETTEHAITTEGVPLQAGRPYVVKVVSSGWIHARLVDDSGSVPLADKDVKLTLPDGEVTLHTDEHGELQHATEVPLGDYSIALGEKETSIAAVRQREEIHIQRVPGFVLGYLKLRLVGRSTGEPIQGASVSATGPAELSGNTDDTGQVDLGVVAAGKYTITVGADTAEVEASSDGAAFVKVVLGPAPAASDPGDAGYEPPPATDETDTAEPPAEEPPAEEPPAAEPPAEEPPAGDAGDAGWAPPPDTEG